MSDRILVQISRGVAPAQAVADTVQAAHGYGVPYHLVAGKPAVEAKIAAAHLALTEGVGLVLCEDDLVATPPQWEQILTDRTGDVLFADAKCRDQSLNTKRNGNGEFLYTGTVAVYVPGPSLRALAAKGPLFVASDWQDDGAGSLHMIGTNPLGWGSDVFFWQQVRAYRPAPVVRSIGQVGHIMHPLNSGKHDLRGVCDLTILV